MKIAYDVCYESSDWKRPSDEVQAGALRDKRYVRGDGTPVPLAKYCWTHQLFVFGDASATIENLFRRLTGLWTAMSVKQQCNDVAKERLQKGTGAELWLIGYRVIDIQVEAAEFTVRVEPTAAGFQIVNVARPAESHPTFRFVDPSGRTLEVLTEHLTLDAVKA